MLETNRKQLMARGGNGPQPPAPTSMKTCTWCPPQVLCGPHMLAVLSPDANDQMWLAQDVCLAIIALAAGSQLRWAELVENMHTVLCLCGGVLICTWFAMLMAMLMVSENVDFLMHLSDNAHVSASVISATVMARTRTAWEQERQRRPGEGPLGGQRMTESAQCR
jgi:hypothetical protein